MLIKNGIYYFVVDILCVILLLGSIIYLIVAWGGLPDQIPGHFDFAGNITRYGKKGELLFMPIMNIVMFAGVSVVERFPQIWNTGVKVTEQNKFRVYTILKNLIVTSKLSVVAPFAFITIHQTKGINLPVWFIPAFFVICFAPIIFFA